VPGNGAGDGRLHARAANRRAREALLPALGAHVAALEEHVDRVGELSSRVAVALGLPEQEARTIGLAGRLHDIGKIGIPRAILDKPGALDEQEWAHVRRHTVIGERIVLGDPALADTAPLIRSSHERVDGNGYPDRLRGASIPLGSRIIAVCDAFDALTSDRVYRRAIGTRAALTELRRNGGSQFDASVVEALAGLSELNAATLRRHADGQPGEPAAALVA
jgi:HD-GYP domain-containing protein (c-di-GMP phosphodiesterase class II)